MGTVALVLMVLALVSFLVGAANMPTPRINTVALGLALWVLAILIGGVKL